MDGIEHFETARAALAFAERKVRYGHRTWLVWETESGVRAARLGTKTLTCAIRATGRGLLRAALTDTSPDRRLWCISPAERLMIEDWPLALQLLRNLRYFEP